MSRTNVHPIVHSTVRYERISDCISIASQIASRRNRIIDIPNLAASRPRLHLGESHRRLHLARIALHLRCASPDSSLARSRRSTMMACDGTTLSARRRCARLSALRPSSTTPSRPRTYPSGAPGGHAPRGTQSAAAARRVSLRALEQLRRQHEPHHASGHCTSASASCSRYSGFAISAAVGVSAIAARARLNAMLSAVRPSQRGECRRTQRFWQPHTRGEAWRASYRV